MRCKIANPNPEEPYRGFCANSTRRHFLYGSYYPRKIEFATGLVFKRNSGCLKKYGGGSSLETKFHAVIVRQGGQVSKGGYSKAQSEFCLSAIMSERECNLR